MTSAMSPESAGFDAEAGVYPFFATALFVARWAGQFLRAIGIRRHFEPGFVLKTKLKEGLNIVECPPETDQSL